MKIYEKIEIKSIKINIYILAQSNINEEIIKYFKSTISLFRIHQRLL